jgi:hypothetical protein
MKKLQIVSREVEEEVFRIFDDYLFDVYGVERAVYLQNQLSSVEGSDLSELDQQITNGLNRAVAAYFPLRR